MEKGSILPSHAVHTDEKVKQIPLPSQMPRGVDFSEIPMSAIKSATLEGLLSQNEDLMARLSVSLRKIHELEEGASVFERERKSLHTRFQTMREQYLVLEAKDKSAMHRTLQQHEENTHLRHSGEKLEKLYTDLYAQAIAFQKRMVLLERYRARIRKVTPAIQEKSKRIQLLETEIVQFRRSLNAQKIHLTEEFDAKTEQFQVKSAEYEKRIADIRAEMTDVRNALQSEHMRTINTFEAKLAEAQQETLALKAKADERDKLYEELLITQNSKIFEQRQFEQSRADNELTMGRLELETVSLRQQLKDILVDREAKSQELIRLTSEIPNLRERNQNLVEQVESLQSLWNHKQREVEQAEEKNKSLQKLNQSLSVTLNQQRKEIHALQVELDKERFTAQEKIKTLTTDLQMLRSIQMPDGTPPEKL